MQESTKNDPAEVQFELQHLDRKDIPGITELETIFNEAQSIHVNASSETYEFFKAGCEVLKNNKIAVLAIRNRNTTGLTNINKSKDSHFHRLVKTTGDTAKQGNSSGAFGIGKHAPFAASMLRTVLYSTQNRENENSRGFQGVIKIASFDRGEEYPTQGTGFYGEKKKRI